MNRNLIFPVLAVLFFMISHVNTWAQTGSRIREGGGKMPESVVWFSEPQEITDIRLLLQEGKKDEAVTKARDYVASMRRVAGAEAQVRLYYGLSALCSALTTTGALPEAIQNCTEAIVMFPSRWQALNNRGVAHFMAGDKELALQDYRQALSYARDSEPLMELIQHNMALIEEKQ